MFDPLITYETVKLRQRERLEKAATRRRLGKIQSRRTGNLSRLMPEAGKVLAVLGLSSRA